MSFLDVESAARIVESERFFGRDGYEQQGSGYIGTRDTRTVHEA